MRGGNTPIAGALLVVLAVACNRPPPPGSGAIETTCQKPSGTAHVRAVTVAAFPGGAVLVGDTSNCIASRFEFGLRAATWSTLVPVCDGVMEIAVAPDSVSYVRTRRELLAIGVSGKEIWRLSVDAEPVSEDLLTPAVTMDSLLVVATGARSIVAYKGDGTEAWRFLVAEDEVVVASPVGSRGEGVYVVTNRAAYNLAADGSLRFRRPRTRD